MTRTPFTLPASLTATRVRTAAPTGRYVYAYLIWAPSLPGLPGPRVVAYVERDFSVRRGYYVSRCTRPRVTTPHYVNVGYTFTALGVGLALRVLGTTPTYPAFTYALGAALRTISSYTHLRYYVLPPNTLGA